MTQPHHSRHEWLNNSVLHFFLNESNSSLWKQNLGIRLESDFYCALCIKPVTKRNLHNMARLLLSSNDFLDQEAPMRTPTGVAGWLLLGAGWYKVSVSVWLTRKMGGILDDLMWRILVSMTSQSICIITSNSLSFMTLSVMRKHIFNFTSMCAQTVRVKVTQVNAGWPEFKRHVLSDGSFRRFFQMIHRGQSHAGFCFHKAINNRWLPHEGK